MYISISTATLELYEWYTYYGRKKEFNEHHKKYDLSIEPKDRFGIRKVGQNYKLIDASDTSTIFTLSEKETKLLVKRSKGFGGKIDGVRGLKGKGGLDPAVRSKKPKDKKPEIEPRVSVRIKEDAASKPEKSVYPELPETMKRPHLIRLFHNLNALYFNNELKKNTVITITNAERISGKATTTYLQNAISKQQIRISKSVLTNRKRLVNVLLHEMVHLLHAIYHIEHGREEYDESSIRRGHGPLFVRKVRELNALGFNVDEYTEDMPVEDMDVDMYALVLYNKDAYTGVYFEKPFTNHVDRLLHELGNLSGKGMYTNYRYGRSRNPRITLMSKLTSKYTINAGRHVKYFVLNDFTRPILDDLGKKEHKIVPDHETSDVSSEIVATVAKAGKIRTTSWEGFALTVMMHSKIPEYASAFDLDKMSHAESRKRALDTLSESDKAYMHKYWSETSDADFFKCKIIKDLTRYTAKGIANGPMDNSDFIRTVGDSIREVYAYIFTGRKTVQEYRRLLEIGIVKHKTANAHDIYVFMDKVFSEIDW